MNCSDSSCSESAEAKETLPSVREILQDSGKLEAKQEIKVSPELVEKIITAFVALEDLLAEAFPNNKFVNRVLSFLAEYVSKFFR